MGSKPNPVLCSDIDDTKWYIVEVNVYAGGDPLTGCERPYDDSVHQVVGGGILKEWVCYNKDCTEGIALIQFAGDAQRVSKIFGPWDTRTEAELNMW
ncbi:MAG TPA: hypothetical protein VMY06_13420 [Sedimentisphaerales bacterium]|nr:hypothetical protein [Sedimentisphaerales bacterium]